MTHMKHFLYILLSCLFLASCELDVMNNDKMDGNWQLRQMEDLATEEVSDMTYSYIYWGIQDNLLQVRDIDNRNLRIFFRYSLEGNQLAIHSPYQAITKNELVPIEDTEMLLPLGITDTEEHFQIEKLSSGTMVLKSASYRLHFRKY